MRKALLALLLLAAVPALPQATGVPYVTPYPGSSLRGPVKVSEFAEYELLVAPIKSKAPTQTVGGKLTRMFFLGPKERSLQEIFLNYEEALRKDGFTTLYRCQRAECGTGKTKEMDSAFNQTVEQYYLSGKKSGPDGTIYVAVMVNDKYNPATRIDVIESRAMQTGLVKITAGQMAKDIAATGRVVLYNILFDTGKADVKPESHASIAEVAELLKANATMKIYVVGHTDNAGTYEANADLSKRRADAVVQVLTSKHGIASARLRGVGVASVAPVATNRTAEGRTRNRRVELVEQ